MFGIIKNQIKTKIGIVLPASYPASRLSYESVSVTADGVKTYATLFNELFALVDMTKINNKSIFEIDYGGNTKDMFSVIETSPSSLMFTMSFVNSRATISTVTITPNSSTFKESNNNSITNNSSQVPTSGRKISIYY